LARGGYRPGSGRKKKDRTPDGKFENAMAYLRAVVCGKIAPDALRAAAAKAILPYEVPKGRTKPESPSPKTLRKKESQSIEKDKILEFERKAAVIRAKYAKKGEK